MRPSEMFNNSKGRFTENFRTICEVHRDIYDLLYVGVEKKDWSKIEEILPFLEEAYKGGVKITGKLAEYKYAWSCWDKNVPDDEKKRLRDLRIHLEEEARRISA